MRRFAAWLPGVLTAAAVLVIGASSAYAGADVFVNRSFGPGWGYATTARHSLTSVLTDSGDHGPWNVGAGATTDPNVRPSSIKTDTDGHVCRSFSGADLLYAASFNMDSRTKSLYGTETYGSDRAC